MQRSVLSSLVIAAIAVLLTLCVCVLVAPFLYSGQCKPDFFTQAGCTEIGLFLGVLAAPLSAGAAYVICRKGWRIKAEPYESIFVPTLHPKQVPGKYWIDANTCVSCDSCSYEAPNNICREDYDGNYTAYVYRQPETPKEVDDLREAMNGCPVGAISDMGTDKVLQTSN